MAVIAVINGKGGAGKSTISSHLAAYCALRHPDVALCDLDPQRSAATWLGLRPSTAAQIRGQALASTFTRPPADARHVVIDTPSGFQGMAYLRVMMYADAVIVPTAFSLFDRNALEHTVRTLQSAPRVVAGKCTIACVGTRVDARSNDAALLETLSRGLGVAYLGSVPAARTYNRCLEQGLTVFDFPSHLAQSQLPHWAGVVAWIEALLARTEAARPKEMQRPAPRPQALPITANRPASQPRASLAETLMRNIPRFLMR